MSKNVNSKWLSAITLKKQKAHKSLNNLHQYSNWFFTPEITAITIHPSCKLELKGKLFFIDFYLLPEVVGMKY